MSPWRAIYSAIPIQTGTTRRGEQMQSVPQRWRLEAALSIQSNPGKLHEFAAIIPPKCEKSDHADALARWQRRKTLTMLERLSDWELDGLGLSREELPEHVDRLVAHELRTQWRRQIQAMRSHRSPCSERCPT